MPHWQLCSPGGRGCFELSSGGWCGLIEALCLPGYKTCTMHVEQSLVWEADPLTVNSYGLIGGTTLGNTAETQYIWSGPARKLSDMQVSKPGSSMNMVHHSYKYHANHAQLKSRTNHLFDDLKETLNYDGLGRLWKLTRDFLGEKETWEYEYDILGNLKGRPDLASVEFIYEGAGKENVVDGPNGIGIHAITAVGDREFSYDNVGNLENDGIRQLHWTMFNKPESIDNDASKVIFDYGIGNRRIRRTDIDLSANSTRTVDYLSGGSDISIERVSDGTSTSVRHYLNVNGKAVAVDTTFESTDITTSRYFHHDRLGSVVAVSDEEGDVIDRYTYDVWGGRRSLPASTDPILSSALAAVGHSRGFTGHEMLDSLELIHMNGRIYNPALGRFMSPDPIVQNPANVQNYNRYSYIQNNPTGGVDPSGYYSQHWRWEAANKSYRRSVRSQRILRGAFTIGMTIFTGNIGGSSFFSVALANSLNSAILTYTAGGSSTEVEKAALRGGLSAILSKGVGDLGESGWISSTYKPIVHAGTQAALAKSFGDSDRQLLGVAIGAGLGDISPVHASKTADVIRAMMIGGFSAQIATGSGFIDAALTAGAVRLYNHWGHVDEGVDEDLRDRYNAVRARVVGERASGVDTSPLSESEFLLIAEYEFSRLSARRGGSFVGDLAGDDHVQGGLVWSPADTFFREFGGHFNIEGIGVVASGEINYIGIGMVNAQYGVYDRRTLATQVFGWNVYQGIVRAMYGIPTNDIATIPSNLEWTKWGNKFSLR